MLGEICLSVYTIIRVLSKRGKALFIFKTITLILEDCNMNYTTQMDAARKGIITKEMEIVSQKEQVDVNELRELIANGQVVIPANKNHKSLSAEGVGKNLRTK